MTRRLSLLTPSGTLTLGNLLGALRPMARAQEEDGGCFYGVADLHAMTTEHDPATLSARTRETQALMLAAGLDPERAVLFRGHGWHEGLALHLPGTDGGRHPAVLPRGDPGRRRPTPARRADPGPRAALQPGVRRRADRAPRDDPTRRGPRHGPRRPDAEDEQVRHPRRGRGPAARRSRRGPPQGRPGGDRLRHVGAACTGLTVAEVEDRAATYGALKRLVTDAVVAVLEPLQQRHRELVADPGHVEEVFAPGERRCLAETAPVLESARAAMGL